MGSNTNDTTIYENEFYNNTGYGVYTTADPTNTTIYRNNFINNISSNRNAYDGGSNTQWYNSNTIQGNYWNDYNQYHLGGVGREVDNNDGAKSPFTAVQSGGGTDDILDYSYDLDPTDGGGYDYGDWYPQEFKLTLTVGAS